jgi:myo-inositol 2-dehydrogenase/D-chiro-inositol 1-dehydrogenase
MRLALLGLDDDVIAVAKVAAANGAYHVGPIACSAEQLQIARRELPDIEWLSNWEALLDRSSADAVLVARADNEDLLTEQLRKLVQAGMPVLVSHPVGLSMLAGYELEMVRSEASGVIMPNVPHWHAEPVRLLSELIQQGDASEIGQLEQVTLERSLSDRSRSSVLQWFGRDVDLLRMLCGEIHRVSAMGRTPQGDYANVGVQMAAESGLIIRWSAGPVEDVAGSRLVLIGSRGKAILHIPQHQQPWQLQIRSQDEVHTQEFGSDDIVLAALACLKHADGPPTRCPRWSDAAKSIELTGAVERSLARGRTVEMNLDEQTEAGTFKGLMTSVGCGLLIGGLLLIGASAVGHRLAVAAGLHQIANLLEKWPYLLLALLAIFLLLQALLRITQPTDDSSTNTD